MQTCHTDSYLTKASVILSSMYIRAFTSSGFSTSSHRNGMWFGSLQFLGWGEGKKKKKKKKKEKKQTVFPRN